MIARRPTRLDEIDAASLPVIATTALEAVERAGPLAGWTVLIHGAAGCVGAYAVQLACRAGARVLGTAGVRDLDYVRSFGADVAVDYRADRFEDVARDVDAVLDFVGGESQQRSFPVLRRGGRLISAVSVPDQALAARYGVTAEFFLVKVTTERLTALAKLIGSGALSTDVGAVMPLASVRRAHDMLEGVRPRIRGKIVLRVSR